MTLPTTLADANRHPALDAELSALQNDYHDIVAQYQDERQRYDQIEAALNTTRDDGPWLN
jgi:hypothetical protein